MTNDTPKEGVVIDVSPEQDPQQDRAAAPDSDPSASHAGGRGPAGLALLLAVLALGLTLAGGWYGHRQWQQLQNDLAAARSTGGSAASETRSLATRVDGLAERQGGLGEQLNGLQGDFNQVSGNLAEVQRRFTEQQQQLERERNLLDEREAQLRKLVGDLQVRLGRSGNQWLVAEADYLLHLADHRLRLAHDPDTARAALDLADQRLRATGNPAWSGVREQIARDLAALDTLERPDITGLWSRLGALIGEVPRLKLNEDPRSPQPGTAPALHMPQDEDQGGWRNLLGRLWTGIKNAVRIRRNDQPVAAMLPPEQSYFLYENLRLQLEQARLALLQGRQQVYHDTLDGARNWLRRHFQGDDAVARGLDNALSELMDTPIQAALPDLSASLQALQARRDLLKSLPATPPAEPQAPPA